MQTSAAGIAFLERHEGVVLKAYRDPVGIWTIGAGLTAASGVIEPRAGMVITREEATILLWRALVLSYEPAVSTQMIDAAQHEFDAAVSFHFNTGAIGKATWVDAWLARDWPDAERRLMLWVKGGGKVLPGLKARRAEEFALLRHGVYHATPPARAVGSILATEVVPLTSAEAQGMREGFATLGFDPGPNANGVLASAVREFQAAHDLTVDGIIGRATLSTLQRMLEARKKAATAGAAGAGAGGAAAASEASVDSPVDAGAALDAWPWLEWVAWAAAALCLARLAWLAWSYRDALAARAQARLPALAALLRRF
ncbi:MAG: lysozyme [Rhodobacteraceae bacterium]|nr:lysozyme [Paracoccaceae bacterium]